jgi:hypothetical protein
MRQGLDTAIASYLLLGLVVVPVLGFLWYCWTKIRSTGGRVNW